MTPGAALNEFERRLARLRAFASMDAAWEEWRTEDLPSGLDASVEGATHQGYDAGYAAAMRVCGIALAEVQTIVLREKGPIP